jgi:hypothetical protein
MAKRHLFLLLALGLVLLAGPARAQQAYVVTPSPYAGKNAPHGYIGVSGSGFVTLGQESGDATGYLGSGGGVGLFIGGRLNPVLSLEGTFDTTFHQQDYPGFDRIDTALDDLYLMSIGGALRLNIPTTSPLEPYFRVGGGYSFLGATWKPGYEFGTLFAHGVDVVAGGGIELYAGQLFSIGLQVNYRGYWFDRPHIPVAAGLERNTNYVSMLGFGLSGTFHL